MWLCAKMTDRTRVSAGELSGLDIDFRVKSILDVGVMANLSPYPAPLSQGMPPTQVRVLC
jgi:hypothetical protein